MTYGILFLSHQFSINLIKYIFFAVSIVLNLVIIISISLYFSINSNVEVDSLIAIIFFFLYCLYSFIYNYYLIRSKTLSFDNSNLYIHRRTKPPIIINIHDVISISKRYFYFYQISLRKNNHKTQKIYFLVTPYITLSKSDNVKTFKKILNEEKT